MSQKIRSSKRLHASSTSGFTLIELLIVIVVVAILAAIATVGYTGITRRAAETMLTSDITNAHKQIAAYRAEHSTLPTAHNCPTPTATEICLSGSPTTTYHYQPDTTPTPSRYSLSATNGTISLASVNGAPAQPSYGTHFVTLTNLIQNGDFSQGQAGWINYCVAASQCIFSDGRLRITADPSGRAWVRQNIISDYTDGDIIFYSVRIFKESGTDFHVDAHRNNGGFSKDVMTRDQYNTMVSSKFERFSEVRTFFVDQGTRTDLVLGTSASGLEFQVVVDDIIAINLTATFGAGNEPSAATMDSILSQFENGWFEGTVTTTF